MRALFLAALMSMIFSTGALALSPAKAERVIQLIEQLAPDSGDIAYDGEEADRWFEDDASNARLIESAGFTRESWKEAFDAVLTGYLALVPQAEIDAELDSVRDRLAQSAGLSNEQKREISASLEEHVAAIAAYRAEGRDHMDVVRPLRERIKPFVSDD